eukprot:scaffold18318_cov54-Phaeocystis_antarctica.AAC.1
MPEPSFIHPDGMVSPCPDRVHSRLCPMALLVFMDFFTELYGFRRPFEAPTVARALVLATSTTSRPNVQKVFVTARASFWPQKVSPCRQRLRSRQGLTFCGQKRAPRTATFSRDPGPVPNRTRRAYSPPPWLAHRTASRKAPLELLSGRPGRDVMRIPRPARSGCREVRDPWQHEHERSAARVARAARAARW